eukprot:jgi/Tetstr1/443246/TSEL_031281.t1
MPAADARGRRERDAQPEACQRCSSGRSLSRSVLNPLPDLPEERDCETLRVAGSPVRCGFITLPTTGLNILSSTRITSQWRASFFYRRRSRSSAMEWSWGLYSMAHQPRPIVALTRSGRGVARWNLPRRAGC